MEDVYVCLNTCSLATMARSMLLVVRLLTSNTVNLSPCIYCGMHTYSLILQKDYAHYRAPVLHRQFAGLSANSEIKTFISPYAVSPGASSLDLDNPVFR
jgi:hypothetical protein